MTTEMEKVQEKTAESPDLGLEVRKVRALEKIAMNLESLVMFFEDLGTEEWSERLQWYLDLFKKAILDPKLPTKA